MIHKSKSIYQQGWLIASWIANFIVIKIEMRTIIVACVEAEQYAFEKGCSFFNFLYLNYGEIVLKKKTPFYKTKIMGYVTKASSLYIYSVHFKITKLYI